MSEFDAWIASRSGACWPAGDGSFLWVAADRRRSAPLQLAEAVLWQLALPFQSRSTLLATARERQSMPEAVATAALARLFELDLVVTAGSLFEGIGEPLPAPPSPVVAVRTFERPEALSRLLESALAMQAEGYRPRPWLVIDDAREARAGEANREIVTRFARKGLNSMYFGPAQRREALASMDRGDDPILSALLDPTVLPTASGARSWNWAMLLSAGASVSLIDDDCVLPVRRPESWRREWSMQNASAHEGRFYDEAMPTLPKMHEDPWEEASALLGSSPAVLARRDGVALRQIAGRTLEQLAPWHGRRRVAAVIAGIHGGHVFNSSLYLNITDEHSLRNLLRPPFSLRRLQGDQLWQGVTAPRMVTSASYTPFMIDNRELVPFAPTHGHADDTAFLALLAAITPEACFALLPMLVGHAPVEPRDRLGAMFREVLVDGNTFAASLAHQIAPHLSGCDRGARLAAVATKAADALAADPRDWQAEVSVWRDRVVAGALDGLAQSLRLAGADAPAAWRDAILRAGAANRAVLGTPADEKLVAQARAGCAQIAGAAPAWMDCWRNAASGWAASWRDRLRLRA
jgi:hypothetical protein